MPWQRRAADYAEAVRWYRLAADQGMPTRRTTSASYANGEGVPQDYVDAHMWFNIAAANGEMMLLRTATSGEPMTAADISEAQRRARVCMASGYQDCD